MRRKPPVFTTILQICAYAASVQCAVIVKPGGFKLRGCVMWQWSPWATGCPDGWSVITALAAVDIAAYAKSLGEKPRKQYSQQALPKIIGQATKAAALRCQRAFRE